MLLFMCSVLLCEQSVDPDDSRATAEPLRPGRLLEEAAFTAVLRDMVRRQPSLPVAHLPPQLLIVWQRLAEREGEEAAEAAMLAWCERNSDDIRASTYLALHWVHAHYCTIIVDLEVWRCGPAGGTAAPAALRPAESFAAAPVTHVASVAGPTTPAESAASATHSPGNGRQLRQKRKRKAPHVEGALSTSAHRVPLLHLDTLPSACGFDEIEAMLQRVCRVLNRFYQTTWPESIATVRAMTHLCGPPLQDDVWSCGHRLLRAWSALLQTSLPWTPQRVNEACSAMAEGAASQLVQETRALYQATSASVVSG